MSLIGLFHKYFQGPSATTEGDGNGPVDIYNLPPFDFKTPIQRKRPLEAVEGGITKKCRVEEASSSVGLDMASNRPINGIKLSDRKTDRHGEEGKEKGQSRLSDSESESGSGSGSGSESESESERE